MQFSMLPNVTNQLRGSLRPLILYGYAMLDLINSNQPFSPAKLLSMLFDILPKRVAGIENRIVSDELYFLIAGSIAPIVAFGHSFLFSLYGIVQQEIEHNWALHIYPKKLRFFTCTAIFI